MTRTGNKPENRRRSCLGACAAVLALSGQLALAQMELPRIAVRIEVENSIFDALIDSNPTLTADLVREKITEPAKESLWGYLDWRHQPLPDSAAQWIIRLEQQAVQLTLDDGSTARDWIIHLNHYARIGDGNEFKLQRFGENNVLYRAGTVRPTHDARQFKQDLADKLEQQLDDVFLRIVEDRFLERIPLASDIVFDPSQEMVIVPLRRSDIRATKETLFGVEFVSSSDLEGEMKIRAASQIRSGQRSGLMIGHITEFSLPSVSVPVPAWWDDRVADILANASEKNIYMVDYFLDAAAGTATSGGVVLEPD